MSAHDVDAAVVRAIELRDIAGFIDCADTVFRERVYFSRPEPFPIDQSAQFVASNIRLANPQLVLEVTGRIVGWCDVVRRSIAIERHVGALGIGMLAEYRGHGLGERLIRATIEAARVAGFERLELQVFAANTVAAALYRKVGFVHEGTRLRAKKLDDVYDDVLTMGLIF